MKTGIFSEKLRLICYSVILLALCSCAVGPDYQRPDVSAITPPDWHWKPAEPKDTIPKGEWWKVFKDSDLDELENGAMLNNQDLRAAVARVDEARSVARISRSQFFPELSLDPSLSRQRTSANQPTPIPFELPSVNMNTYSIPLDLSYEIDLWGRVRRSFEAAQAQAQASVSDYHNVLLTLTADVAVNYFLIRALDSEISTLSRTIELRNEYLRVVNERFSAGTVPEIDVARAKTDLASSKADLADTARHRAETLHALALLCGRPASSFEITARAIPSSPPVVPPGLPSSLLERRPDIARAERRLAAKNAEIGVAVAGYFPVLRLTGQVGYLSSRADDLFSDASRVWLIGSGASLPLFTAGRTAAGVEQAEASYREALAQYRQTILTALKETEDSLAQIILQSEQATAQDEALASAKRVSELARARYEAGTISSLELVDAERDMLRYERQKAQLSGQRFASSIRLIKALGGGWQDQPYVGAP